MKTILKNSIFPLIYVFVLFFFALPAMATTQHQDYVLVSNLSFSEFPYKNMSLELEEEKEKLPEITPEDNFTERLESVKYKKDFSLAQIKQATDKLESKNKISKFIAGNNLAVLKFQKAQLQEHIFMFEALSKDKVATKETIEEMKNEIALLEEQKIKVEMTIQEKSSEFSLLGLLLSSR